MGAVQGAEKMRFGLAAAASQARDVPVECQLQGLGLAGLVLSPTWLGSQDRALGPGNHSEIWSSGSQGENTHRHLLPLWLKPLPESKGRRKEKALIKWDSCKV